MIMVPIIDFEDKRKVVLIILTIIFLMVLVSVGIYHLNLYSLEVFCLKCVECELCECPKEFYFVENYSRIGNEFYADIDKFQRVVLIGDNLLVKGD